jgi:hypothetical protein
LRRLDPNGLTLGNVPFGARCAADALLDDRPLTSKTARYRGLCAAGAGWAAWSVPFHGRVALRWGGDFEVWPIWVKTEQPSHGNRTAANCPCWRLRVNAAGFSPSELSLRRAGFLAQNYHLPYTLGGATAS